MFVATYYPNMDNKFLIQRMYNKLKNIRNEHRKSIYKDMIFILSLKEPKDLNRELTSSRFISNFKSI